MKEEKEKPAEPLEESKMVILIVNGRKREWHEHKISFREVVVLAFGKFEDDPRIEYTVGYSNGPRPNPQGIMVDGISVKVQEGMNFNVSRTDKS